MKIAVLFIATGRYITFWKNFYTSCEEFFLKGHQKTYFLFTDSKNFDFEDNENVVVINQKKLGWPYDTLMRFDMFLKAKEQLKEYDYMYFINGTMHPVAPIGEEIFPSEEQGIMVTCHPGFYKCDRKTFSYDKNPKSSAYISDNEGQYYFMGGFNGGISSAFLKLCEDINQKIKADLKKGIIALWHDESQLNKYVLDKNPLILTPDYAIPELISFNQETLLALKPKMKMIICDKSMAKYGGPDWLRGVSDKKVNYLKIVKLMGGLGNQMFQYAFSKALQNKFKEPILLDLSWFEDVKKSKDTTHRPYDLDVFNLDASFATPKQVKKCMNEKESKIAKFFRKLRKRPNPQSNKVVEKNAIEFDEQLLEYKKDAYYIGYYQSEKYFEDIRELLLKEFSPKEALDSKNQDMLDKINSHNSVSLHVRRGDYVTNPNANAFHGTCSLDYYKNAIEYISSKVKNPHFYLFSDDINWVIENLKIDYPFTIVDINNERAAYLDMELMKHCKHNIIANSSFSWWGAWLNENPDKIVIAPQKWFNNPDTNTDDLLLEDWIKI